MVRTESTVVAPDIVFVDRATVAQRASRAAARRAAALRPGAGPRRDNASIALRTVRAAEQAAARELAALREARERLAEERRAVRVVVRARRAALQARRARAAARPAVTRSVVTKHAAVKRGQRVMRFGNGMTAVIAFARSQVGKSYVTGGEGPSGFDCSGFTKRAYALAGIRLPHSSTAQAARARIISRSVARAGDLVIGPGHVGIYMGNGMMIDAGNHRTGVIYRRLYSGLRVARF